MNILNKIQNLSDRKRRTIFWLIIIIVGIFAFAWWAKNLEIRIKSFKSEKIKEELQLPRLEEELKSLPKFEMPEISDEELKKFEEILKETQP
jgi:hypothetical protein